MERKNNGETLKTTQAWLSGVRRVGNRRDVLESCLSHFDGLAGAKASEHFLVFQKEYAVESAVIAAFCDEQKLAGRSALLVARSATEDSFVDVSGEDESLATFSNCEASWTTQHATLRHVRVYVKKSAATATNQVVRIFVLEGGQILEQGVFETDKTKGAQRIARGSFDFVRVQYVIPAHDRSALSEKKLWDAISRVTHVTEYQRYLYALAKRVITYPEHRASAVQLKSLTNKVIELDKNKYNHIFPPIGWFVTPKLDGKHGVLTNFQGDGGTFAVLLSGERVAFRKPSKQRKQFAIEVEVVDKEVWVIDVVVPWDYENKARAHLAERIASFPEYVAMAQNLLGENFKVRAKPYFEIKRAVEGGAKQSKRPKRVSMVVKALEKELPKLIEATENRQIYPLGVLERDDENARRIYRGVRKYVVQRVREGAPKSEQERTALVEEVKAYAENSASSLIQETDTPAQRELIREAVTAAASFNERQTDGIIFASGDTEYSKNLVYKWKPAEQLTIDFVLARNELSTDKNEYVLLSGIDPQQAMRLGFKTLPAYAKAREGIVARNPNFVAVHFQPFLKVTGEEHRFVADAAQLRDLDLDGACVELSWSGSAWRFHRVRADKTELTNKGISYGNNHFVAEKIWNQALEPLKLAELYDYKIQGYFGTGKDPAYNAITRYHSIVKHALFAEFCSKPKWALDIASGKGQDMLRYLNCEPENVIFSDSDLLALDELIERRYGSYLQEDKRYMNTHVVHGDASASETHAKIKAIVKGDKLDFVVCSFAIHYMVPQFELLAKFIADSSAPGCRVMLLFMNGKAIHELFMSNDVAPGDTFTFADSTGKPKYALRRQYEGTALAPFGQNIDVKLPFRNELAREMLVNPEFLVAAMARNGFKLQKTESFSEVDPGEFEKLNDVDQRYSSINMFQIYVRQAN